MTSYDKPLLAKQLFKLINFEILRQGSQIQTENSCRGQCGEILVSKNYYITLDLLSMSLLLNIFSITSS